MNITSYKRLKYLKIYQHVHWTFFSSYFSFTPPISFVLYTIIMDHIHIKLYILIFISLIVVYKCSLHNYYILTAFFSVQIKTCLKPNKTSFFLKIVRYLIMFFIKCIQFHKKKLICFIIKTNMLSFALIKKKTCKKSWKLHVVCVICENTVFSRFLGGHLGGHLGLRPHGNKSFRGNKGFLIPKTM